MMRRARRLLALGPILALTVAPAVHARAYPTNACVGTKQKRVADYCRRALEVWGRWDVDQDVAARNTALARAAARLEGRWLRAERASLAAGADCTQTTTTPEEARTIVDDAVHGIVSAVNAGLDLGKHADAACGRRLLDAAALECKKVFLAEGAFVRDLAADPHHARHDAALAAANAGFAKAFARITRSECPTTATEADLQQRIDGLRTEIVRQTTISPFVPDAQFATIDAPGSVTYEGRTFHPVCARGGPYAFFAKRGTVNKLVVYYQGGGACWENLTCSIPVCDINVDPAGGDNPNNQHSGFADLTNPQNPFRDWNIVFVSYCSCDIHFGDAAQDYAGLFPTVHVEHRGFQNAKVVEKWAREHFVNPEEVFVTGSSAGAYGAWFHAPLLESVWPASRFNVLADAGNGVVTQQFLDDEFPHWNFEANLPPDIPGLVDVLHDGSGIPGYTKLVTSFFPETRWAHYSSAFDGGTGGQTGFYNVMLNPNDVSKWTSWWNASCAFNEKMRMQAIETAAAVPSNYRYYIGTGSRHTMYGSNKVYTDTTGGVPTIVSWINAMLGGTPAWTNVECANCGLLLPGDPAPSPLVPPFFQRGPNIVIDCNPSSPSGAFLDAID